MQMDPGHSWSPVVRTVLDNFWNYVTELQPRGAGYRVEGGATDGGKVWRIVALNLFSVKVKNSAWSKKLELRFVPIIFNFWGMSLLK